MNQVCYGHNRFQHIFFLYGTPTLLFLRGGMEKGETSVLKIQALKKYLDAQ